MTAPSETAWLIDTFSLIFQVFHAIPPMTSPRGVPVNAVFGIARDLMGLRERKPHYLLCAMDRSEPTFRSDIFPDYKAHRPPAPDDLISQFPLIEQLIEAMAIPILSFERFEADDLLATAAFDGQGRGIRSFICTSDKDCRQLLSEHVRMFNLRKGTEFGEKELMDDWGVRPDQVVDLQAMVGDSVDNVPGVAGIGYKTGAKLLAEFGTLEGILQNIDKIPGAKKQEAFRASLPQIPISRKLVELNRQVPMKMDWENWRLAEPDYARLLELYREWGFRTLASQAEKALQAKGGPVPAELPPTPTLKGAAGKSRAGKDSQEGGLFAGSNPPGAMPTEGQTAPPVSRSDCRPVQGGLFDEWEQAGAPMPATTDGWDYSGYRAIQTEAELRALVSRLEKEGPFAIDLETTSLNPRAAKMVGIAISNKEGEAAYLPIRAPAGTVCLDEKMTLAALRPLLESPVLGKINQNLKYDMMIFLAHGISIRGIAGDPMIADYLLHAGERSHGLDELARRYLDHRMIPITDLIGVASKREPQKLMSDIPLERVVSYAGEDADVAFRLAKRLESNLSEWDGPAGSAHGRSQMRLYKELELPLIGVIAAMEMRGIRVDQEQLRVLGGKMGAQLVELEAKIHEMAGGPFDIASLPQLRRILFGKLGLPALKKTGITKEPSTDQETLEKLAVLKHPGAAMAVLLLELRKIGKLKSTYVDTLPELVDPATGRVHASFHQTIAATGRLSSSDPNLQNIPIRDDMGQEIRKAFLPREGWDLWTADYSQIELRLLAHLSGDVGLKKAYEDREDIHTAVAAGLHGVSAAEVTPAMRRVAKTVNFGVVYGISAHGLADRLQISRDEAAVFIDAYFTKYPGVLEYQEKVLAFGRTHGYCETILGRRRRIEGIRAKSSFWQRNQPEREAINMVVQGSAADLIKMAMIGVAHKMEKDGMRGGLLLQIHDELVLEAPVEERAALAALLQEEMVVRPSRTLGLEVPLEIDSGFGPNWVDIVSYGDHAS